MTLLTVLAPLVLATSTPPLGSASFGSTAGSLAQWQSLPVVLAQQLNDRRNGFGTLTRPSRRDTVRYIRVRLDRNKDFVITMENIGDVRGTWRRINDTEARLEIEQVTGLWEARGVGTVRLFRGDQLRTVDFSGNSRTGRFSLSWRNNDDDDDNRPGIRPPIGNNDAEYLKTLEYPVDGRIRYERLSESLRAVRSSFDRRGRFWLEAIDPDRRRTRIEGSYSRSGRDRLSLNINRFDGGRATGSGSVNLDDRDRISDINLRGRTDGRRDFSMSADRRFARP